MRRFERRLRELEAQQEPAVWRSSGLAALLAYAALHPPAPWELPDLADLTSPPTGLARLLLEARQHQMLIKVHNVLTY
jgi:hypothetical protein